MEQKYYILYFDAVTDFLKELPSSDEAKIRANIDRMRKGDFNSTYTKKLKGPIKELIVKEYRVLFFIHENVIHFIRGFRKKSAKTPREEIDYAEQVYKRTVS